MTLKTALETLTAKLPSNDDQLTARLHRAYEIVRQNGSGYTITKSRRHDHYVYHVQKASTSLLEDSSAFYTVDENGCSCHDAAKARAGLCKHRLATLLVAEMEKTDG